MKFQDKYTVEPEFEDLFSFKSKDEEIEHEATMIMFRFLSELEKFAGDKPLKKKDIALAIGTSPSFVTQLFQGDKLLNLVTIAKLQDVFSIKFEITAKDCSESYKDSVTRNYELMHIEVSESNERNASLYKDIPTFMREGNWRRTSRQIQQKGNSISEKYNSNIRSQVIG